MLCVKKAFREKQCISSKFEVPSEHRRYGDVKVVGRIRGRFRNGVLKLVGRKKGRLRIWGCGSNDKQKTEAKDL